MSACRICRGPTHACNPASNARHAWPSSRTLQSATLVKACSSSSASLGDPDAKVTALGNWLRTNGAIISEKIEFCGSSNDGRSGFAREAIEPGEILLRIPWTCIITQRTAACGLDETFQSMCSQAGLEQLQLSARLLADGAHTPTPSGHFALYYAALPRPISTPLTWEPDEIADLMNSDTFRLVQKKMYDYEIQYAQLRRYESFKAISWSDFLFTMTVVSSRSWKFETGGMCLVPFMDLFNHHPVTGYNVSYEGRDGGVVLTCTAGIPASAEVCVSYGPLGNEKLLVNYGFALELNEEENEYCPNAVFFTLSGVVASFLYRDAWKRDLLQAAGVGMDQEPITVKLDHAKGIFNVVSLLRLAMANEMDKTAAMQTVDCPADAYRVKGMSISNELRAMAELWDYACRKVCQLDKGPGKGHSSIKYADISSMVVLMLASHASNTTVLDSTSHKGCMEPIILDLARTAPMHERGCATLLHKSSPVVDRLEKTPHSKFARIVVDSERRVWAQCMACAATLGAITQLSIHTRAQVLPKLETAPHLKGLTLGSRRVLCIYIRGFHDRLASEFQKFPMGFHVNSKSNEHKHDAVNM